MAMPRKTRHGSIFFSMSTDKQRLSTGDTIAFVALILAFLGIAAVLIPPAYPNASVELYQVLLWLCIVVASLSAAFLVWHHLIQPRWKRPSTSGAALFLLGVFCICAIGFDFWDHHYNSRPRLAGGIVYTILGA